MRDRPRLAEVDRTVRGMPRAVLILVAAAAAVIVVAGLQSAAGLVGPIVLALVVVITISPVERALQRRGIPHWLATAALVILVQGAILVLAAVIVVSAAQLATVLPQYQDEVDALVAGVASALADVGVGREQVRSILGSINLDPVVRLLGGLLTGVAGLAGNLVFLLSLLLFLGIESTGATSRLAAIARDDPSVASALGQFTRGTRKYMLVTTVIGLVVATIDTVALIALGIPLAVLWGLLTFITNYIPYVGFFLGVIPPALLGLLEGGWQRALAIYVIYTVVNFVLCTLLQPRFVGNAVDLSMTITLISLVFWAWVLGPLGAVLAVPLTLLVKALLFDGDPRAGWARAILGGSLALTASPPALTPHPRQGSQHRPALAERPEQGHGEHGDREEEHEKG